MIMSSEQRLIDIESRIAFQEHTLSQLNTVVIEQQKRIDALILTCETLRRQLQTLSRGAEPENDEPPPHY